MGDFGLSLLGQCGRVAGSFAAQDLGWITQGRAYGWSRGGQDGYSHQCETSESYGS